MCWRPETVYTLRGKTALNILGSYTLLARLYEVMECLYGTTGARCGALSRARDKKVQFLRFGQFLSNYIG